MRRTKRETTNLLKIDRQLSDLDLLPLTGRVERRLALAIIRESRTALTFSLLQTCLTAFGVIAAAYAISDRYGIISAYLVLAAFIYVLLVPVTVARRGRRAAVRAILDHRIAHTAAEHELH